MENKNGGVGLERYVFVYIDCLLDEDFGFFILGKFDEDELYIMVFKILKRYILFVFGYCIYFNDYLKGIW